ncbi:uncharacterized protein [Heterodontus francisci]|uniref:uncharacterized protein n=1 Tax=Heterodontus francisci TaxID=7792 RepID=UPI00355C059A
MAQLVSNQFCTLINIMICLICILLTEPALMLSLIWRPYCRDLRPGGWHCRAFEFPSGETRRNTGAERGRDLTKAFDTVSRARLDKTLGKIACPPKLLSLIHSLHDNMHCTVQLNRSTSDRFRVKNGVKQDCVLAPTLFGIFFSMLLTFTFPADMEGVYLHTRIDGKLYNPSRLKVKTKTHHLLIREHLYTDDAVLVTYTETQLKKLMDCLFHCL